MKKRGSTVIVILILVFGLSLLLYPAVSNFWNSFTSSRAIGAVAEEIANMDEETYSRILEEAELFNEYLPGRKHLYVLTEEEKSRYDSTLDITGTGIMGYIEIPKLSVMLPIYHGTSEAVLQVAVGHIEWTALPIGGEGNHSVLSGHRGLPSAKLFSDLDKLSEGDTFCIRILDEILTYEVDQIKIIKPDDTTYLQPREGEDLCTLMTCTPYGVNSHRLLVRGHRIENTPEAKIVYVTSDAAPIDPVIVAAFVALPILLALFAVLLMPRRPRYKKGGNSIND